MFNNTANKSVRVMGGLTSSGSTGRKLVKRQRKGESVAGYILKF